MKSYRQQKRKITEITRKQDELMGVSVKKSATGPAWGHPKTTESITKPHLEPRIQLQVPSAKIKLQLFPINEQTRLGLEKDGYNPFLELTLSARKRISSVARHLNTKWGSSSVAIGQLVLFPYNIKLEQVASCRRWTSNDNAITAWEVYVDVGRPSFFRLRYAWYSNLQHEIFHIPPKASLLEAHTDSEGRRRGCSTVLEISSYQKGKLDVSCETIQQLTNVNEALTSDVNELKPLDGSYDLPDDAMMRTDVDPIYSTVPWDDNLTNLSIGGLLSEISLQASLLRKMSNPSMKPESETSLQPIFLESSDISIGGLLSEASLLSNKNKLAARIVDGGCVQTQSPWDDNLTTLSIGGLLSEVSLQGKAGYSPELNESKSSLQLNAHLLDSYDSLISAQLNANSQIPKPSCNESNLSILDAEETCHAFPIQKLQPKRGVTSSNGIASSTGCRNGTSSKQFQFPKVAKMNNETVLTKNSSCQEMKLNPLRCTRGAFDENSSLWPVKHQED
ncbi:TSL-kinase interacting protein 1 isoform X2 [Sesamum indicum]|uniref:TSL-kinase interacting protein 1 isoform X2 n=1 Tax=Sesamum indicum TaxID=4182 RepID=A0A6I9UKH5_SESIN|nr:TSL-kinase interacting protein 1 isoform X2 [Sesamum indicum]